MITTRDKKLIAGLIKQFAAKVSTERMLAYIGDTNGMLFACKLLVEKNRADDREVMAWVDLQCYDAQVDLRNFLFEITRILTVFQPDQESDDPNFDILGLESGADKTEIKQAYRKLSLQCHPDTASSESPEDTDEFVKITEAYKALLNAEYDNDVIEDEPLLGMPHVLAGRWRQEQKSTVSKERKKKNIIWFIVLAGFMVVISLFIGNNYRQKAMRIGLQSTRSAFIPPIFSTKESRETKEPVQVVDEKRRNTGNQEKLKAQSEQSPSKIVTTEIFPIIADADLLQEEEAKQSVQSKQPDVLMLIKKPVLESTESTDLSMIQAEETNIPTEASLVRLHPPIVYEHSSQSFTQKNKRKDEEAKRLLIPLKRDVAPITLQTQEKIVLPIVVIEPQNKKKLHPSPEELKKITKQRIEHFVTAYTNAYKEKNILSFSRFFDLQATENDQAFGEIMPTYIQLFQEADRITLVISIVQWNKKHEKITIDGRFKINIRYKSTKQVLGKGEIQFLLSDVQQQFLIKELHYQFD